MYGIDPGPGLPPKIFANHLDALLETGQLNPDILYYATKEQQIIINEVKKSLNRLKRKYARHESD